MKMHICVRCASPRTGGSELRRSATGSIQIMQLEFVKQMAIPGAGIPQANAPTMDILSEVSVSNEFVSVAEKTYPAAPINT